MRFGRVQIHSGIVVDLDNEDMLDEAKDAIIQDISNIIKFGEEYAHITATEEEGLSLGDIPDYLWDDGEQYVIWSEEEGLFWSNEEGWVDFDSATEFDGHERPGVDLPIPDGKWMNMNKADLRTANPENDEFNCARCHKVNDIENSIKKGEELFCPNCGGEE